MSTPEETSPTSQNTATPADNTPEPTLDEVIGGYVSKLVEDKNYELPDDIDPVLKYAVMAEKRRRDTQATYTKTSQALKKAEAERAELLSKVNATKLSEEQLTELETLKHSDPDAYYTKRREYEQQAELEFKKNLEEVSVTIDREAEIARRAQVLEAFNKANDIVIDDDLVANEVPPKYLAQLEKGEISFEQFLQQVLDYVKKPVQSATTPTQPNLNNLGGGAIGDYDEKQVKQATNDAWKNTIL